MIFCTSELSNLVTELNFSDTRYIEEVFSIHTLSGDIDNFVENQLPNLLEGISCVDCFSIYRISINDRMLLPDIIEQRKNAPSDIKIPRINYYNINSLNLYVGRSDGNVIKRMKDHLLRAADNLGALKFSQWCHVSGVINISIQFMPNIVEYEHKYLIEEYAWDVNKPLLGNRGGGKGGRRPSSGKS